MTQEVSESMSDLNQLLDRACGGLTDLVKLGERIPSIVREVQKRAKEMMKLLPCGDACLRIATNYSIVAELSLLVCMNILVFVFFRTVSR